MWDLSGAVDGEAGQWFHAWRFIFFYIYLEFMFLRFYIEQSKLLNVYSKLAELICAAFVLRMGDCHVRDCLDGMLLLRVWWFGVNDGLHPSFSSIFDTTTLSYPLRR